MRIFGFLILFLLASSCSGDKIDRFYVHDLFMTKDPDSIAIAVSMLENARNSRQYAPLAPLVSPDSATASYIYSALASHYYHNEGDTIKAALSYIEGIPYFSQMSPEREGYMWSIYASTLSDAVKASSNPDYFYSLGTHAISRAKLFAISNDDTLLVQEIMYQEIDLIRWAKDNNIKIIERNIWVHAPFYITLMMGAGIILLIIRVSKSKSSRINNVNNDSVDFLLMSGVWYYCKDPTRLDPKITDKVYSSFRSGDSQIAILTASALYTWGDYDDLRRTKDRCRQRLMRLFREKGWRRDDGYLLPSNKEEFIELMDKIGMSKNPSEWKIGL